MAPVSGDETAPFFGFLGAAAAALVFSCMGAAYGTAKSGVGVASMGVMRPELVRKSIVPVVMAGVLGIYGLIIAVTITALGSTQRPNLSISSMDKPTSLLVCPAASTVFQLEWPLGLSATPVSASSTKIRMGAKVPMWVWVYDFKDISNSPQSGTKILEMSRFTWRKRLWVVDLDG